MFLIQTESKRIKTFTYLLQLYKEKLYKLNYEL
jgi:hypothetical protein